MEVALNNVISARTEYLYMQAKNFSASAPIPSFAGAMSETAAIKDSLVRAGLNFRFVP